MRDLEIDGRDEGNPGGRPPLEGPECPPGGPEVPGGISERTYWVGNHKESMWSVEPQAQGAGGLTRIRSREVHLCTIRVRGYRTEQEYFSRTLPVNLDTGQFFEPFFRFRLTQEPVCDVYKAIPSPEPASNVYKAIPTPEPVSDVCNTIPTLELIHNVYNTINTPEPVSDVKTITSSGPVSDVYKTIPTPGPVFDVYNTIPIQFFSKNHSPVSVVDPFEISSDSFISYHSEISSDSVIIVSDPDDTIPKLDNCERISFQPVEKLTTETISTVEHIEPMISAFVSHLQNTSVSARETVNHGVSTYSNTKKRHICNCDEKIGIVKNNETISEHEIIRKTEKKPNIVYEYLCTDEDERPTKVLIRQTNIIYEYTCTKIFKMM
ncbi:hypothetical protein AVEN_79264-1 [Araneus ventricosus]|uniref:Uncharacterized protein n=1 Tax=Araneus ventricosus TaxID=182803 RepID=A0A4Y2UQ98_ARAVE|nr:hypothetical protein AVEN_79264-1 [Araneus ventricosus]